MLTNDLKQVIKMVAIFHDDVTMRVEDWKEENSSPRNSTRNYYQKKKKVNENLIEGEFEFEMSVCGGLSLCPCSYCFL